MTQATKTEVAPIEKTMVVAQPVEEAFRIYTEELGRWWPLQSHARNTERRDTAALEPGIGGRLYERTRDGEELDWGEVQVWDPPHRLVHSWHLGRPEATEVELRFTPEGAGTRVELVHRGWDGLGDEGAGRRSRYDSGWDFVFGECFGGHARKRSAA
jgi:uncharacterized protein YndB with AHSA1/START domain